MALLLIRHGHRKNSTDLYSAGLTKSGRKEAKKLGRYLKSSKLFESDVKVISSSSPRCVQTAMIIGEELGASDYTTHPLLKYGFFDPAKENLWTELFAYNWPEMYGSYDYMIRYLSDYNLTLFSTLDEFGERFFETFNSSENYLLVSHDFVVGPLLEYIGRNSEFGPMGIMIPRYLSGLLIREGITKMVNWDPDNSILVEYSLVV